MTGKTGVWPVKSAIRPNIVCWPAIIFSPGWLLIDIIDVIDLLSLVLSTIAGNQRSLQP